MEVLRLVKHIKNNTLEELNQFVGKDVEIIILSEESKPTQHADINLPNIKSLRGALKTKIDGMEFQNRVRSEWNK